VPDSGHAADDGRPDEDQNEAAELGFENAEHAFVAREQPGNAARGGRIDRKQLAGNMDHAHQPPVDGHVDTVIVAWAEVERRKGAIGEAGRQLGVATEQRRRRVLVALGLKDLLTFDTPELADGAVDRAQEVRIGQRPGIGAQRARKEVVEGLVAGGVWIGGLVQVDAVTFHEPADDLGGEPARLRAGKAAGQGGKYLLGQQVLG
jgi:hypothetical protein